MNNLKDLILVVISLFFWSSTFFSQTYIGPTVGYDFQKVLTTPIHIYRLDFRKKGFGYNSPFIGINIKQNLLNKFYLQVTSEFTHKHVRGFFYGSVTDDLLFHYNNIKNALLLSYYWKNKWKIGSGMTYNIVNSLYHEDIASDHTSEQRFNYSEQGWIFILGLKYNKFEFEGYYQRKLSTPIEGDAIRGYHYHQIQSLGLRVSYDFKIFDGCKKKDKLECPPLNKMALVE